MISQINSDAAWLPYIWAEQKTKESAELFIRTLRNVGIDPEKLKHVENKFGILFYLMEDLYSNALGENR